jgi:tetratricopeptide (TPR) repeat protein
MRVIASGLVLVLAASTALAAPKPKEEAKRRIDRAAALHKEGKYDDALAELEAAYKLDPQVDLLFAIGQVYAKLGRCDEARTEFEQFAAKKKTKQASQIVEQAIAACIPKAPPVPPPVEPAPASVTAPAAEPIPAPAPALAPVAEPAPVSSSPATFAAATSGSGPELHTTVESAPRPWYRDTLGDGLVLAGVAAAVVGFVEYHGATAKLDDAETASSLAQYDQLVDDAHGQRTVSVVLFAGGAALVGAGIARYALHDRGRESHGVAVVPAHGGGLLTWTGGF